MEDKKLNFIVTDETSKSVAVLQLDYTEGLDIDELMDSFPRNKKFIELFMEAVKDDLAIEGANYSLGDMEYFGMECFSRINVYVVDPAEDEGAVMHTFYVEMIAIYS